jgi:hypothetical protein
MALVRYWCIVVSLMAWLGFARWPARGAPLEEARALDGIGHSYLHDGCTREATAHLRHALTIYQRIGAPAAQRVRDTLRLHGP